ncbi:DUF6483 family protein [Konateibacter massiliensis]|uniref:DUF6483 family protein n=1 Tax=Konateibacter massiliensis TaxID=2002841 RepID=UPI000C15CC86|nr:DUF6483 family protein [Konateibacter massiliensis]
MFKEDYVMKMIHELVKTVLKLMFHIDNVDDTIVLENEAANELYKKLMGLTKEYKINDAENFLYENLDENNMEELKAALLFYEQLNYLSDDDLENADFSREEIKDGIQVVLERFGCEGIAGAF